MGAFPFIVAGIVGIGAAAYFYEKNKPSAVMSFDEFIDNTSKNIDSYMLDMEKKDGVTVCGGECKISIEKSAPDKVLTVMTIYSYTLDTNGEKKWTKSDMRHSKAISEFKNDSDTAAKLQQIRNQPLELKITHPEKEME